MLLLFLSGGENSMSVSYYFSLSPSEIGSLQETVLPKRTSDSERMWSVIIGRYSSGQIPPSSEAPVQVP